MLFMVVERFRNGDPTAVGARFARNGRMLPDGVVYVASWMETSGASCYQLMEAESADHLDVWIARWSDLAEFDVMAVETSADFWAMRGVK